MSEQLVIGYRIKDVADPNVPYVFHVNFGQGWEWATRAEVRGRTMPRDVAVATMAKMRAWAQTPEGSRFRVWMPDDLRLVRVVKGCER